MAVVLLVSAPLLASLTLTMWRTPMPLSEAVALFEDVARYSPVRFFGLDTSYYRPLYHLALSLIWNREGSIDAILGWVKLLQIIPVGVLVILLVWNLRPRRLLDAAAAAFAVAVLVGSPAFRDNLELPLSYTTLGMPIALAVWMLLSRPSSAWHTPSVGALTIVAIGFKEQGLVIVPLVLAMWWLGAPGAGRHTAAAVVGIALVYVAARLSHAGSWPLFEQEVGYGFERLSTGDAAARFGTFPLWIFAYSGASTMANVLFSEPTAGVFRIVRDASGGRVEPWALIHLCSSTALTGLVVWWAVGCAKRARLEGWSTESRTTVALGIVLLACGALSLNYSRDRLGGMAIPFYAMAAFYAVRAAASRAMEATTSSSAVLAGVALLLLAGAWQSRAVATVETARVTSLRNRLEWLTKLPERRVEFADRPVYLRIMESMVEQGTASTAPHPTRYPRWVEMVLREP
jgi:hypothetical protein